MLLLWLGGLMVAGAGIIYTKDGKTWAGRIELRAGPALQISGPSGTRQIQLTNVHRAVFGEDAGRVGLSGLSYELYSGTWLQLPDFTKIKPTKNGQLPDNLVTLYPNDAKSGYGMVFVGKLHVPMKGIYQFFMGSDDGTRLSLDGNQVIDNDGRHGFRERQGQIELATGKHDFKLEYFNHSAPALLRLDWSGPSVSRRALSREGKPVIDTTKVIDPATELAIRQPGALTWNGAFVANEVIAVDQTKLTFEAGSKVASLSTIKTAAIFYHAISVYRAQALRGRKSGILLTDGQFIDGKIRWVKDGEIEIQSVLFGRKKYNVSSSVSAVVFGMPNQPEMVYRVRTQNGMIYVPKMLKADNTSLQLDTEISTPLKVQRDELREIECGPVADPLNAAWRHWDGLEATARGRMKSRESAIASQARAIAKAMREQIMLQEKHREAAASLEKGRKALELTLKSRELSEADARKCRTKVEQAQALLQKENRAYVLTKEEVARAESELKEMIAMTAAAEKTNQVMMAKVEAEQKEALANIDKHKANAAEQLKKSGIQLTQIKVKAMQNQQVAGIAATNRLNALATLVLEQKRLARVQMHLQNITGSKADIETRLTASKTASAMAQKAQGTAQGTFNARKTAFNIAKAAVETAILSRHKPAVSRLASAEQALKQAKLAVEMAEKKLAEDKATLASLNQEKTQLAKTLLDLGKAHGDKQKSLANAQIAQAKAEAQAESIMKKALSSRTTLLNLVAGKQVPALAAYKDCTNMLAESHVAKTKADEQLKNIQVKVAMLLKAAQVAESAAKAAESESQAVQKDTQKSDAEKVAAKKKSVTIRQSADMAKAAHAKMEAGELKLARDQIAATATLLAKAMMDQVKARKGLDTVSKEVQQATDVFNRDDQSARVEISKARVLSELYETLKVDLVFITKRRDEAGRVANAAATAEANFDKQKVKPGQTLVLKNRLGAVNAGNLKNAATQAVASVEAEIKRLTQSRQTAEANLASAKVVLDRANALTRQSQEQQMMLKQQLASHQKSFVSASTEKSTREKAVSIAESDSKRIEKDMLSKLKPAAESQSVLALESMLHKELEQQLADELKAKEIALQELRDRQKIDLASAESAHQGLKKSIAEQEKILTEIKMKLETGKGIVQVAESTMMQAELEFKDQLKVLAGHSKAAQDARIKISALQSQRAAAESALNQFLFANRVLLNLR